MGSTMRSTRSAHTPPPQANSAAAAAQRVDSVIAKAPWIDKLRLDLARRDGPPLMVLATVDADGAPTCRTVVLRRIDDNGIVAFCSHRDADKNKHLHRDARAAGTIWIEPTRSQFRLRGRVTIHPSTSDVSRSMWSSMSDSARALFAWPTPGESRAPDDAFVEGMGEGDDVPETFEAFELEADEADVLVLEGVPHDREIWTRQADHWVTRKVNP
jgi:pyridoxamine 5'-phosphate oxidase